MSFLFYDEAGTMGPIVPGIPNQWIRNMETSVQQEKAQDISDSNISAVEI
jgi:hypothetical protein